MRLAASSEAKVGVIMLDTAFPRPLGDIGNPATFGGQGLYEIVSGATASRVIEGDPRDPDLLAGFLAARDRLIARGASVILTSCGILAMHQQALQKGCSAAVISSALIDLSRLLGGGHTVGVMAMDSRSVSPALLQAVGAPADTPVIGLEEGLTLYPTLKRNQAGDTLDLVAAEADVIAAGLRLKANYPKISALLLECANLPPYRAALSKALGLPVYDVLTLMADQTALHFDLPNPPRLL